MRDRDRRNSCADSCKSVSPAAIGPIVTGILRGAVGKIGEKGAGFPNCQLTLAVSAKTKSFGASDGE